MKLTLDDQIWIYSNKDCLKKLEDENDSSKRYLFLLLERGEIDLSEIIRNLQNENRFSVAKMRFYWEQMLEAVEECHQNGVIHADIKPANFVLVKGQLKIIDFGLGTIHKWRHCIKSRVA